MVDLYKQPEQQPLPRLDNFKSFDANGQEVTNVIPENSQLYNLPPDQQEAALAELQKPPSGEELAYALAANPNFEKAMTVDEFMRYDDYMKTVETEWIEGIMTGAGMVVDEIGNGLSAMYGDDQKLKRAIPTLAEGFARGTRDMYGLVAQSADPQSPFFKFKELLTGAGSPEERFQQFKEAREFNRRSFEIMEGKANVTDIDPDLINPQMAQALSYVADPSWALPFVGQAGKAMGISAKSIGLAKLSEQIAVVGSMAEHAKRLAFGGVLKVAGAPLNLLGDATMRTISWGADRAAGAFEFATGMAYQDSRRIVRDAGLYGGTIFRVPYMSTISDSYMAGFGAKGLGEAMDIMGDVIMGRKRGVYSYAEEALAAGKDVLSPQAKAMLRILNQADPILSYGYAAMEGMTEGAIVGAALGYGSARGEGAAQGIGMGAAMGAGGALMGRAWAGMARNGGIIHQRVLTELEFVKNAMRDVDPEKLAQIETLQELAALHGQDLSWQILGILKLAPDLKIEVLDSIGFEQQRRKNRGPMKEGEVDPVFGLDLDDPNDIKKVRQIHNYEGVVVQHEPGGQTTLYINSDHYKKYTFGHEMFHGIMRTSAMGEEFIKDLREKLMGRVTENGIELPGVIEPAKMRSFMERYIKAVYSNNPEQRDARLRALDAAIKAYEADGTLIPGQDDARPILDNLVEEAGAYYFSHMIEGRDMDWLYRGGDLGGIRQVIADAKEGIRDFIEAKFGGAGMDFNAARTLHEAFLAGGREGGKRIRIGALDALMEDIIRRQAGSQEGRVIDFSDMTGDQQRRFRDRNGLGDVLQPRKNGGMDSRRRTAAEESARAKQIVDVLRAMNDSDRTSMTVVEKNGDVTIYGNLSDAELNQLVRVGAMLPTEASRYRMFRDVIANKGKGANVFGAVLVGESFEMGEGRNPRRLRRSKGDKVPTTNREFMPIEMRTEIRLTKGGKGKATFVVTGLDIKNADMRLRELWFREDVQKSWGGDYNAFAADFYMYLQNISDPNGVPSAEIFGGGQKGSYKRNVFHEAFGAAMKDGETPFNEPSPTYKGAFGRGEKFVIYSMTLGSMYDVKLRDRNVPYNHSIAYDRIRRNWSPSEMRREVMPDGEKLTHEESGYSFVKGPNGKWRAYDNFRHVVGVAEDVNTAAEVGRKAYIAEQARQAKEIRNLSVNEKTEITAKGWAPLFFSAVEKFVKSGAITPNMHPEQVWARISKASFAGIRADELRYLGLKERILGKDNAHLQNAREMDRKVQELFTYSQRFASQDPAKFARVQEVAANLRKAQQAEYKKGIEMQRKEQADDSLAIGKPIGEAGLAVINKHIQDRALGLRMTEQGTGFSSYVADGAREDDSYVILTARSNQRTGVTGHFGDDVIVHIRVDVRTDPNTGERVLVVHEIQANNAEERESAKSLRSELLVEIKKIESEINGHKAMVDLTKSHIDENIDLARLEFDWSASPQSAKILFNGKNLSEQDAVANSRLEIARQDVGFRNANDILREGLSGKKLVVGERLLQNIEVWIDEADRTGEQVPSETASWLLEKDAYKLKLNFTPEFVEMVKRELQIVESQFNAIRNKLLGGQNEIRDVLADVPAKQNGTLYIFESKIKNHLFEILSTSPFRDRNSNTSYIGVDGGEKIAKAYGGYDLESRFLGLALAQAYHKANKDIKNKVLNIYDESGNLAPRNKYLDSIIDHFVWAAVKVAEDAKGATISKGNNIEATFTGLIQDALYNSVDSETAFATSRALTQPLVKMAVERYQSIIDAHAKDFADKTLNLSDTLWLYNNTEGKNPRMHDLSSIRNGELSEDWYLSLRENYHNVIYALRHLVGDYLGARTDYRDAETRLQQAKVLLGFGAREFIAQTPQDWVVIGLKMAMRRAAEQGIRTVYLTDAMGGPYKCGMDYMSATAHYDIAVPNLANGFLRQYGLKVEMPVRQKRYSLYYDEASGETKALGSATGVSWQEQLGYIPRMKSRVIDGKRKYRVEYVEPAGRMPFQQQDIQRAQMKNMARFTMSDEVMKTALDEGFRNLSPSEGGETPKPQSRTIDEAMKLPGFAKFAKGTEVVGQEEFHYILDVFGDMKERVKVPTGVFNREPNQAIYDITRPVTLIAYHGSTSKRRFETLRTNVPESESYWAKKGSVDSALGTHYTNDETLSSNFTRRKMRKDGDGWDWSKKPVGQMYEVAVRMDKPLYFDGEGSLHAKIKQAGGAEAYKASLVEQGYDGIIYRVEGERQAQARKMDDSIPDFVDTSKGRDVFGYIPFNEGNVKDLQNNVGTFDRSDNRINYSPSEKPIGDFGKEPFVTGKNKFSKAVGMFFRERETGKYYVLTYGGIGGEVAFFEPAELYKKELELVEKNAPDEQIEEVRMQAYKARKTIKPPAGSGGLGYRGIEDQMRQTFDAYSKTEPGEAKPAKPDGPELDVAAIKTNGDAIKDALTSLDGLAFTKDETFRLFGRRSTKGRTLGLIDEINAEVDKAKAGEQPDVAKIEEKLTELEEMRDEMQEKQENTPEGLQETEAYQNREENIDAINEAIDEVRMLMEPPKNGGSGEVRNMSVAENAGAEPDRPYKGHVDLLSRMELWAVAAKDGKLGPEAKINHKLITAEVLKTVEWLLTNDNSGVTSNRPKSFATEAEALKWIQKTALTQYKGPNRKWAPASLTKSFKDAYLAATAMLGEPTKKPRSSSVEPKAKDGASFDDWFNWARKKRVNGKSMATAENALKFIAEMPGEGYYKAVAQMLLAMGPVGFLKMQLYKTGRGFMQYGGGGGVGKIAISERGGGKSGSDVSLKGRIDNTTNSTVDVVIEEVMHAAQMTNANYGPMKMLKGLGSRGVSWKQGALKLIAATEADIKGKTYNQLGGDVKERLMAARLAKLILDGTKGIPALTEGSGKVFDLHEALFGNVVSNGGVWRNEGDPSKGGGAGKKLRFRFQTKEQVGTNKASEINGYHFGNVAEFLVGLFSDPNLARLYFDRPPVDLSTLTPKGDPLRTSWRNLASQMIAVAMDFFNGLFGNKKKNYGSQLIEETVLMLQRQAEAAKKNDPARDIDAKIGTYEVGFPREPAQPDAARQRGRQPSPGGEPIPMGMNTAERGLATIPGEETVGGSELGPATQVVDGEAVPIPRRGRPTPQIGMQDKNVPAQRYYTPPPAKLVSVTPVWSTGDAMAGKSILTSTAGYMVMLVNGKWRVYNPEKQIIGVFNDEEKAKGLADRRAARK